MSSPKIKRTGTPAGGASASEDGATRDNLPSLHRLEFSMNPPDLHSIQRIDSAIPARPHTDSRSNPNDLLGNDWQNSTIIVDMQKINSIDFYSAPYTTNPSNNCGITASEIDASDSLAVTLLNEIINAGGDLLYAHYLDSKMNSHVLNRTFYLAQLAQDQWDLPHDAIEYNSQNNTMHPIQEDSEPTCPRSEAWRCYNIEVEKKPIPLTQNQLIDHLLLHSNSASPSVSSKGFMRNAKRKQTETGMSAMSQKSKKQNDSNHHPLTHSSSIAALGMSTRNIEDDLQQQQQQHHTNNPHHHQQQQQQNNLVNFFAEFKSNVVASTTKDEIDRVEEQLRILKQRELELRQQKEEMDAKREAERLEQKNRLKAVGKQSNDNNNGDGSGNSGNNGNRFAYDFNGQIMGLSHVRIDRFPATAVEMSHAVSIDSSFALNAQANNKYKLKTSIAQKPSLLDQQNSLMNEKQGKLSNGMLQSSISAPMIQRMQQPQALFPPTVEVFDRFTVNKGVTLIEGGKVKKGADFFAALSNVDMDSLVGGEYGKMNSLSKEDYNALISGKKFEKEEIIEDKSLLFGAIGKSSVKPKKKPYALLPFRSAKVSSRKANMGTQLDPLDFNNINNTEDGKIHVKSQDILQTLKKDAMDSFTSDSLSERNLLTELNLLEQSNSTKNTRSQKLKQDTTLAEGIPKSEVIKRKNKLRPLGNSNSTSQIGSKIVDDFNRQIVKSGNMWGSMLEGGYLNSQEPPILVERIPSDFKERHVFGNIEKFPRERLLKKSQRLMTHLHLGSPAVGNTMGHGYLGDGFNPNRLVNPEKFKEGIRTSLNMSLNDSSGLSKFAV